VSEIDGIQFLIGLCAGVLLFGVVIPSSVDAWLEHKWQQAVKEYRAGKGENK
jgi:hypothetical protein